jgi:hypothetical protein
MINIIKDFLCECRCYHCIYTLFNLIWLTVIIYVIKKWEKK